MSHTIDPIEITKSGVRVGGHTLRGATRWTARHDYERGLFEVTVTLCTSKFTADLDPSCNGMITGIGKPDTKVAVAVNGTEQALGNLQRVREGFQHLSERYFEQQPAAAEVSQ